MSSTIPFLTGITFLKAENNIPILNQIDDQDEEFLKSVKPCNQKLVRYLICEYSLNKHKNLDEIFKKFRGNNLQLRIELQKFMDERKIGIENVIKHLK